ncbi:hypothetical protein R1flu_011414 [Riccia fluitans]|uniref:GH18 domain-containing protein n=1 Tax=Riccia fluitans TaxID=41844 RepID=A0ABD1Z7R4_9MARC
MMVRALCSAGRLAAYWGQNGDEGSLADACTSGNYDILMVSFLSVFGTSYLWDNYLGGGNGPMGPVQLDGIDLAIESGGSQYYSDLITGLRNLASTTGRTLSITAAPQCVNPDVNLGHGDGTALTTGVDMAFVQIYNSPGCDASRGVDQIVSAWNGWAQSLPSTWMFLGLPASSTAASANSYVDPDTLIIIILPQINTAANYGVVMLWDVSNDGQNDHYSAKIKPSV